MNLDEAAVNFHSYSSSATGTFNDIVTYLGNNIALQWGSGVTIILFFLVLAVAHLASWYSSNATLSNYRKRCAQESVGEAPTKNEVLAACYNIDKISQNLSKARFSSNPVLIGTYPERDLFLCDNYHRDHLIASILAYTPIDKAGYSNLMSSGALNGGGNLYIISRWITSEKRVIKAFYVKLALE